MSSKNYASGSVCQNLCSTLSDTLSEKQNNLIKATANWVVSQVSPRLNYIQYSSNLVAFRKSIIDFLTLQFKNLDCANLRTIGSHSNLYEIAVNVNIPTVVLPQYISIIINNEMSYYLKKSSLHRNIISY